MSDDFPTLNEVEGILRSAVQSGDKTQLGTIPEALIKEAIESLQEDGFFLLHEAIKNKNEDVALLLTFHYSHINLKSRDGSPLSLACRYQQYLVADNLLQAGANVEDVVVAESSSIYNAVLSGSVSLVDTLILCRYHGLNDVPDDDLSVMLYGACTAGHLELVKRFVRPKRNIINSPLAKVPEELQHDCSKLVPLYVACREKHTHIARYLIHEGADVTKFILQKYHAEILEALPDVISTQGGDEKIIYSRGHLPQEHAGKLELRWKYCQLYSIPADWLTGLTEMLVCVDLSFNKLTALPSSVPWEMKSLETLNVSSNNLTKLSEPSYGETCPKLNRLVMDHNQLQTLPQEIFHMPELKHIDISHNNLIEICPRDESSITAQNRQSLGRRHNYTASGSSVEQSLLWSCYKLTELRANNNKLKLLPSQLYGCLELKILDVSHNEIPVMLDPWRCPMEELDLSHNAIEEYGCSVALTWDLTLQTLNLSHNKIKDINTSVCALKSLELLDYSYNELTELPDPEAWACKRLATLKLSHNKLGYSEENESGSPFFKSLKEKVSSLSMKPKTNVNPESVQIPDLFSQGLRNLNLSHNCLKAVPTSVSHLTFLQDLNLSHNPEIQNLPEELGKLQRCTSLKLDGLDLKNIPQSLIKSGPKLKGKRVLAYLRSKLRCAVPYHKMKMIVLGKEKSGKSTLIKTLREDSSLSEPSTLSIKEWKISGREMKKQIKSLTESPDVTFHVWDLAGNEDLLVINQVFMSENTLYILVWDVCSMDRGLEGIREMLQDIQSRAPKCSILVVGNFLDRLKEDQFPQLFQILEQIQGLTSKGSGTSSFIECINVSCETKENISILKQYIYQSAITVSNMSCPMFTPGEKEKLIGRKVPRSFIKLEELLKREKDTFRKENRNPVLFEDDLCKLIEKDPMICQDLSTPQDVNEAAKFLHDAGVILHFDDHFRDLNNLYFIDPCWLADILSKIMSHQELRALEGFISMDELQRCVFSNQQGFDQNLLENYVQLLERFEIALQLEAFQENQSRKLLIPLKLPRSRPGRTGETLPQLLRLYNMYTIPSGFWSRFIVRMMVMMNRLKKSQRMIPSKYGDDYVESEEYFEDNLENEPSSKRQPVKRKRSMSWRDKKGRSAYTFNREHVLYWREGLTVIHQTGSYTVERFDLEASGDRRKMSGIMITVESRDSDFSSMGFIVDQIEALLAEWYPGTLESIERKVPCSVCLKKHTQRRHGLSNNIHFFELGECAREALREKTITCPQHEEMVELKDIIPDLLLQDLSKKFFLKKEEFDFQRTPEKFIGGGAEGQVYKGVYKGQDVAVKLNHSHRMLDLMEARLDATSQGTKTSQDSTGSNKSDASWDSLEVARDTSNEEAIRNFYLKNIIKSFTDLRQEVSLLSQFKHPCIVALIGVCLDPQCFVLEFAPLGDLRSNLNAFQQKRDPRPHLDKRPPLLSELLTYKIILQIALALEYLHSKGVTYRDLKPDNILVCSMDIEDPINIKVSDYGISRFNMPQGVQGVEGTPGYQAPEVLPGASYDNKVDIFSLGMVIFEVISGCRPFDKCNMTHEINSCIEKGERPSLQELQISSGMPCLEGLMKHCWKEDPVLRPSSKGVVENMTKVDFYCLQDIVPKDDQSNLEDIYHSYTPHTEEFVSDLTWLWGSHSDREQEYYILDVSTGIFKYTKEKMEIPRVTCMARVRDNEYMVGTEKSMIHLMGYSRTNAAPGKLRTHLNLDSNPVCMVHWQSEDKSDMIVFVGQDNGHITLLKHSTTWHIHKTLTIDTAVDMNVLFVSCMLLVNQKKELWVSCRSNIFYLSTTTLMKEGKLFDFSEYNNYQITNLKASSDFVFVSGKKSEKVFQLSVTDRSILCTFDISVDIVGGERLFKMERLNSSKSDRDSRNSNSLPLLRNNVSIMRKPRRSLTVEDPTRELQSRLSHRIPINITSMVVVKDALWVGLNHGIIQLYDIDSFCKEGNSSQQSVTASILENDSQKMPIATFNLKKQHAADVVELKDMMLTQNQVASRMKSCEKTKAQKMGTKRFGRLHIWRQFGAKDVEKTSATWDIN